MNRWSTRILSLTLLFYCAGGVAQTLAERGTPLDQLAGSWVMTGTIAGNEVVHDLEARWVLGGHYLFVHELARERDENGMPAYESRVYFGWDEANERLVCMWLDITGGGGLVPEGFGYGKPEQNRIPFVWGEGAESGIHNTFSYSPEDDRWSWQIDNIRKGQASNFARVTLERVHEGSAGQAIEASSEAGILSAIERLSAATESGGAGADAYASALSDDFQRWSLSQENVQGREDFIEAIRRWWDEGWRVASRESLMLDSTIVGEHAYTQRLVTEAYRGPDGAVSDPSTFALEETWQHVEGRWLLKKATVYPVAE